MTEHRWVYSTGGRCWWLCCELFPTGSTGEVGESRDKDYLIRHKIPIICVNTMVGEHTKSMVVAPYRHMSVD